MHSRVLSRSNVGRIIFLFGLIGFSIHLSTLWLGKTFFIDWRMEHLPIHSAVEMAGSLTALFVASFLLRIGDSASGTSYNVRIACVLIAMGILDGVHALEYSGQSFVWLHSTATFIGGVLSLTVLFPKGYFGRFAQFSFWGIPFLLLIFALASILFPQFVPPMVEQGEFTPLAKILNIGGGVGLLVAAIKLAIAYRLQHKVDDLLFCLLFVLFGSAGVMFEQSSLWDLPWWGWHLVRLQAYGVALWYVLHNEITQQQEIVVQKESLEQQVLERTHALQLRNQQLLAAQEEKERINEAKLSQQLEAKQVIDEQNTRMTLATDSAGIGIWEYNIQDNSLIWDDWMFRLYGVQRQDFSGAYEAWEQGVHPEDRDAAADSLQKGIAGEAKFDTEFRIITPSGDIRYLKAAALVVKNEQGKAINMIGVNFDITERRQKEAELQTAKELAESSVKAKSDFLANMSHEIRTPMNAVLGLSRLCLHTQLDTQQRDYIEKIHTSGKSLLNLINDILDFSKMEAGKLELEIVPFKLDTVFENLSNVTMSYAHNKGIDLLFDIPSYPIHLLGDPLRIGQVLTNLVSNAIKFTEQGEVVVSVSASEVNSGIILAFSISDTGIGIDKAQQALLFTSFTQADSSITRKFGGSGLGLAISKQLINLMGGDIQMQSELGKGSVFRFNIELEKAALNELSAAKVLPHEMQNARLLVVDDSAISRQILCNQLQRYGLRVSAVSSGREALKALAENTGEPYKLVIMDWKMPELDGVETAKLIRKQLDHPPAPIILMVTAHYGPEGEKIFKQAGLHYYLNKPVSDSDLFNAILGCFHLSHESKGDETEKWSVPQYSALKGVHVLLVEDNLLNQQIASELLVQGGIKVSVAENGKRAVELVEAEHFDAVLMDLQMPVMGGLEATTEIRKLAHRQTMPIIAMTANAMKTQKQQCFDVGMNDHVSKPIDADKLLKVLLKWVKTNNIETDVKKTDVSQKNNVELSDLQLSVLNISHALSRNGDNEESLLRIIRLFVEHHSPDLLALQNARQDNNFETAGKLIHTLAGIAGFVGALDLENKAQTYNRAFHSGEREELVTLLDAVLDSLSLVLADLHTILKTKT